MKKLKNLIILFLPLLIGVPTGFTLLMIGHNITNPIIQYIFVVLGAFISCISIFFWIGWLLLVSENPDEKKDRSIYDDLLYEMYLVDMMHEDEELYHMLRSLHSRRRYYIY